MSCCINISLKTFFRIAQPFHPQPTTDRALYTFNLLVRWFFCICYSIYWRQLILWHILSPSQTRHERPSAAGWWRKQFPSMCKPAKFWKNNRLPGTSGVLEYHNTDCWLFVFSFFMFFFLASFDSIFSIQMLEAMNILYIGCILSAFIMSAFWRAFHTFTSIYLLNTS